jgi:hypothetical protein
MITTMILPMSGSLMNHAAVLSSAAGHHTVAPQNTSHKAVYTTK